ncbi:LTA synthase family protein [Sporomusa sp.]|uniref:LTA synthase family protein n=1 Tax=Sporomusa sp. TaxID=2078658 RepID=UPI002B577183|nr:sulfatase-like hydrolase/transferase [Sporomusa sp.]HWR45965.1 sulfatase-like hydrolase/transferase [Sporomusa sp.]
MIKLVSWEDFCAELQQDFKLFIFILGVFCLFRVGFIAVMHSFLSEAVTLSDIAAALYYGFRISLKSAGLMVLLPIICCTGLRLVVAWKKLSHIRLYLGAVYVTLLSFLFQARIPYYQEFRMAFNQLLFNTLNDDVTAIVHTVMEQYNLPVRVLLAVATALLLSKLLKRWLASKTYTFPRFSKWYQNIALRAALLVVIYYLTIFVRFGGSMTYAYNIDWENSGITKDQLLNEAILDDVQALYRAYVLHERVSSSTGLDMDPGRLADYGGYLAERPVHSANLDEFLRKRVVAGTNTPPKQVFLIIGESYANWPLLPQYSNLNIANGLKNIIAQDEASYVYNFLPNGMSTISGVMGVVTGLAEANLYLNYLPESYQEPYATSLAPQMKRLGYTADFWYAGPTSWEKVKDFTLAQGFDSFYGMGDFESSGGNVWGCDDYYLYKAVLGHVRNDKPGFHVILTVSNHSPYTVDLAREGFDPSIVAAALPENLKNDQELIKKLGHFWYADKMLAQFVKEAREQYPDSLFVIVGDHADRVNIETNPPLFERYAIPFVVYGKGITKESLAEQTAGSHINVTPTLLELVAPDGFEYYSLGHSLTKGNQFGMNYGFWITPGHMGKADSDYTETHLSKSGLVPPDQDTIRREIDSARAISWWRIKYGKQLKL